ncbi:Glutathione S-transferase GstB|nr:Glutathione S-transferase GstB [Candidatus Pantoea persica]
MLKILGRDSSINVRKVLWLCDELDLEFELEEWGVAPDSLHKAEFLALNPNARIPVLIDDDLVMWELNAILRYLANAYEGDWLYPQNPCAHRSVDGLAVHRDEYLVALRLYVAGAQLPPHQDPRLLAVACKGWSHTMGILNQQLEKTGHLRRRPQLYPGRYRRRAGGEPLV